MNDASSFLEKVITKFIYLGSNQVSPLYKEIPVCVVFCAYAALMRAKKPETVSAELVLTVCSSLC